MNKKKVQATTKRKTPIVQIFAWVNLMAMGISVKNNLVINTIITKEKLLISSNYQFYNANAKKMMNNYVIKWSLDYGQFNASEW
jgi:hypothetical protein